MSATTVTRRQVNYAWVTITTVLTLLLGWAGNAVLAFVRDWSDRQPWFVVPAVTVLVAVGTAIVTAHVNTWKPEDSPPDDGGSAATQPGGGRFVVSVLAVAVVVAAVGAVLTFGVRYAVGWATGDEPGVDRLVRPASATDRGLTLSVEGVVHTRHFTRVTAVVDNRVGHPVSLPVFGNAVLAAGDGTTVEADAFRSDWVDRFAPGASQRGVLVFDGHLPDGAMFARLSFVTVFGSGFEGPDSITLAGMRLRPPADGG